MRAVTPLALLALAACTGGYIGDADTDADAGDDTGDTLPACDTVDALVTDIDATLTTSDGEWLTQILDDSHDPAMRPDANTLMQGYAAKGYAIFYVTARGVDTPMMGGQDPQAVTESWLLDHGFPFEPGRAFLASGWGAWGADAQDYKVAVIEDLEAQGYVFDYGYGNADTDIGAFRGAGMPDDELFLVGDLAGQMGVTGIPNEEAYTSHLAWLDQVPDAPCPDQ